MCKSNLLSSTAITKAAGAAVIVGAFSLPMGFVLPVNHALAACTPLTAGADNVTCIGALDGTLSDALAGNDTIAINTNVGVNAGATVTGGADDDSIALTSSTSLGRNVGSAGQVLGDAGADTITLNFSYVGYFGAGTVSGGVGNDSIVLNNLSYIGYKAGSTGMVLGDAGADTIMLILSGVGYSGAGTVSGGAGNDSIAINSFGYIGFNVGGTGQVLGDAGADTITLSQSVVGYYGAGTVDGGDENDSIALSNNTRIGFAATGTGQVLGNAGSDTITLNNSHVGVSGAGTVSGGAENDSIALTNGSFIGRLAGSTGQVLGDAGADTITIDNSTIGNLGAGTVDGGADNDSIALSNNVVIGRNVGSTGQVLGDAGSDTITINNSHVGYSGAGTVSGGLGNDSIALSGASRIGNLAGSTGQILGDTGADTITLSFTYVGNFGDGTVSGGADNDSIALSTASIVGRNVGSTGQVLGDAGADTITLDNSRVGNALGSAGTVSGGAGGDSIALSNNSVIGRDLGSTGQILGDAGADTITLNNSVVGFEGDGTVDGGADNDSIALTNGSRIGNNGGGGRGMVLGDTGADTITLDNSDVGFTGDGTVSGGADNDSIAISNGSSIGRNAASKGQVLGDAGADTITINNSYVGRAGEGTVDGGAGDDSIALSNNSFVGFVINHFGRVLGDAGADTITIDNSNVGESGNGTISGGADNDSIALTNGSRIGNNATGAGQVLGDAGADTITINYGLVGASGAGTVSGGADNDSIALSNNTFVGNLAGSTGQVLGDAGADTITIDSSSVGRFGAGTVSGGANNDSIALSNGSFVGRSGGSTGQVLGDAGNDTITLANTTVGVTGNATVDGGTENDSIALSAGTNVGANGRILGNAGNDTISVDNSVIRNAAAVFDGGADTDQLTFTANANATVNPGEFVNFELLRKGGAANLTLTGNQTFATSTTVAAGSLTLGGGTLTTGLLDILNGGTFIPFSTVIGNVNNAGLVSPGGGNNQDTLTIQGDFTQSATGQLDIDIFAANGVADLVAVTGTATLGGTLNLIINGVIAPTNTYTILTATTVAGTFATVQQTAAIAQTVTVNPTNVVLEQSVDFAANAGTPNQIATGANLNDILLAGGASGNLQAAINAIGGIVDIATFQTALDLLHSEPYLAQLLTSWYNAQNFAQSMMSCPVTIDGSVAIGVEGECSWARIEGRSFDQDRTAANIGIEENVLSFSIGAQFAIAENASNGVWHLGLGANYEYIESDIDTRAASEGHRIALAASLKGQWGDTTLSTVLTASYGSFDMARFIVLPGFTATALGEQDVSQIGIYTRLAHSFIRDTHYIRPMIDLSANYIHTGSLTETGAGALGLNLASTGEWIFAATPAIEFGADIQQASGTTIRPFLRAGVTFLGSDQASVATSFIGAPAGVTPFRVTSNYDNVFAVIETGVTIINNDGLDLKLNYSGNFGENTQTHAGGFKLSFDY